MQGDFSAEEQGQLGSDASSLQQDARGFRHPPGPRVVLHDQRHEPDLLPPGFFRFLDNVLANEDKTRRLGYLIRQTGLVTTAALVALAAVMYITMYKSPIEVKVAVGLGSTLLITAGSILVRLRRAAKPDGNARGSPRGGRPPKPPPPVAPNQEDEGGIRESDSTDGQYSRHEYPEDDLGGAGNP
jgi:hypothetical protein